jgi:hypothetical protein
MMAKYQSQSCNVNVIAYHNSLVDLKSVLNQIYKSAPTEAQRIQLPRELEEALQRDAKTDLGRRRICARRLLSRMDWNDLWAKKLAPRAKEISNRNPIDPEIVIRDSVRHCSENPKRWGHVIIVLDKYMDSAKKDNPKSCKEIEEKLNEALKDAQSERDKLFIRIRFLFVQFGFNTDSLIDEELLPKGYKLPQSHTRSFLQRKRDSVRTWFRSRKNKEGFETSKQEDEAVKSDSRSDR